MKTAIVTDSTAYLPEETRKALNIHMVSLQVTFGSHSHREEDLTEEAFYQKAKEEFPKTSQPPLGEFVTLFNELSGSHDEIVSIHLSSGISGTYAGSQQAAEMVNGIDVYSFDSELTCALQGFYVVKAAKMAENGADAQTILNELNEMKKSLRAYFMVEDLKHLQRGGRLSSAQALIGGMLQIKPILHFQEKVIIPFEKVRTRKKAMNRIVDLLKEDSKDGQKLQATIIHANRPEEAKQWCKELGIACPDVDFEISYFGPVIGTHLGEGAMGLGWVKK
ncbi:protein degV [Planococcus antarcticus DSM 14505]|uniref:Protein degV n=1 Tax=Planococcus antarcticus DSM 14505 TaxID=1185653 RepID=A0A1C7DFS1_9BACL|nr:DegV family protein [Planococcus antarcticus]ANU10305.1 fatty acid-binding protein DegV [Planococcus antarcticus DSM 14505]EIM05048.1 protein degV [Planococcus antarcticus DSM 14505]